MSKLINKTYDELQVGDSTTFTRPVSEESIQLFAAVSGDTNPIHLDAEYAKTTQFGERIAHGMLSAAYLSAAMALYLPGPGSIYVSQTLNFRRPVKIGDTLHIELTVKEKIDRRKFAIIDCVVKNQDGKEVVTGEATALVPTEKVEIEQPPEPRVQILS